MYLSNIFSPYEWARVYRKLDRRVQFNGQKQLQFLKALKELLLSAIPLVEACKHLNEFGDAPQKQITNEMLECLRGGFPIANCVKDWFPSEVANAIAAGEESGDLAGSINKIVEAMDRNKQGIVPLFLSLFYPILLFVGACFVSIIVDKQVIFQLAKFDGFKLTSSHTLLQSVSEFSQSIWAYLPLAIIIPPIIIVWLRSSNPLRIQFSNIPPFNLYNYFCAMEFLRGYTILSSAKIPEKIAFEKLQEGASNYLKYHLQIMLNRIKSGGHESSWIDTGLIPDEAIAYLKVVSRTKGYHRAIAESEVIINEIVIKRFKIATRAFIVAVILFVVLVMLSAVNVMFAMPKF